MGRNFHLIIQEFVVALFTMVLIALEYHPHSLLVHFVFATSKPWLTRTHNLRHIESGLTRSKTSPNQCHNIHTHKCSIGPWNGGKITSPILSHRDSPRLQEGGRRETNPSYSTLCSIQQISPLWVEESPQTHLNFGRPSISNQNHQVCHRLNSQTSKWHNFAFKDPNHTCESIFDI